MQYNDEKMTDVEKRAVATYFLQEFALASAIFFIAVIAGIDKTREIFFDGIGSILVGIGALWLVGAFFRANFIIPWAISTVLALSVAIFGFGIAEYGFFGGMALMCGFSLFFSIFILSNFNGKLSLKIILISIYTLPIWLILNFLMHPDM